MMRTSVIPASNYYVRPLWAEQLEGLLGCPVQTDPDVIESLARDRAPLAPAGVAAALVRARNVEDIVATLKFANVRRIPVVTRGGGSGLAGGANAVDGCILLSVAGLDQIVSIDAAARIAVVQPGVINSTLAKEVADRGLFYAPDPSSRDISTIGGNIATNAGGACCLKYGVTGDHVAQLKVILADGSMIETGAPTRKNVAGLDLTRLMVGSEGTLGIVVEATMRLLRAPAPPSTLLAFYDTVDAAAKSIVGMDAFSEISLLEIMDQVTTRAVEDLTHMDLDTSAAALLLVQSDARHASAVIEQCEKLCQEHGATVMRTDDPEEGRLLLNARRMALAALEAKGMTLLDDVSVPKPAMPAMLERIQRASERHGVVIGTFGHAGDGNLHPTIVFDNRVEKSEVAAYAAFDEIIQEAVALGGSITGEHGIGSIKRYYYSRGFGDDERALMRRIKTAFDPNGILNPGKGI